MVNEPFRPSPDEELEVLESFREAVKPFAGRAIGPELANDLASVIATVYGDFLSSDVVYNMWLGAYLDILLFGFVRGAVI